MTADETASFGRVEGVPPAAPALRRPERSRLTWPETKASLKGAIRHAKADRVSVLGGSLAYRWFLSLFPTLILLLAVSALLHLSASTVDRLVRGATTALPAGASGVVSDALTHASGRTAGALGVTIIAGLVALWSATAAMSVLQVSLDMAYEIPQDRRFLKKRLVSLALMVGVAVLGGASAALVVFGPAIGHAIAGHVSVAGSAFVVIWTVVRWVAAVFLVTLLFAFVYWLGPNRATPRWRWVTAGSLVGGATWLAASLAFSYYSSSFGSYGKTYGAFAGVALLIFWLYITALAVLLGAEINAEVDRRRDVPAGAAATPEPAPG
jgi:membrane protein